MNTRLFKRLSFIMLLFCFSLYSPCVSAQPRSTHSTQTRRTPAPKRTPQPKRVPQVSKPSYPTSSQIKKAETQRLFTHYSDLAYTALNRNQYALFLRYSDYALQTGINTARLYYDRGYVYELLGDYNTARKEYKKADRQGYTPARYALRELELKMLRWR